MKFFISTLIATGFVFYSFSQQKNLEIENQLKNLIKESFVLRAQNMHESKDIDIISLLQKVLNSYSIDCLSNNYTSKIKEINEFLFKHSKNEYEDSIDLRKTKFKRSAGFTTIALLTKKEKSDFL